MVTTYDELRTERLLLRRWRDSDREPFARMNADPDVMRHFPSLQDRASSDGLIDRVERLFVERGYGFWALETLADGEFIGFTGLNPMPDGVPGAGGVEVGWRLPVAAWGHGYATEAAEAALGVAFDGLRVPELWSMTAVTNVASQRVMQRLGMTPYADFDHPKVPVGSPVRPHVVYRLANPSR